jgi:hypothetical protein
MATTPADDPLVNSDRTVGVWGASPFNEDDLKPFKRYALLFDQIAIPPPDRSLRVHSRMEPGQSDWLDELDWLRDRGIVRHAELTAGLTNPLAARQYLGAVVAETGEPIEVSAMSDQETIVEFLKRLNDLAAEALRGRRLPNVPPTFSNVFPRMLSVDLRLEGLNAFPILETRRHIGDVFPSGTAPVLEVIIKSMPIPDDETAWQDIIEFRKDPESMKRLRALRVWVRKFAKDTTATSLTEIKEEIEVLLDEYEEHMKLHRMKVNKGATETLLTVAGKVAEDLVKLKWGELVKLPFILRERKISLLEAEAKAPNRELAFISMARSRFSR